MKNKAVSQKPPKIIDPEKTIEFLLKEYDRLVEYQKITIEDSSRWFNVYLGIASAAIIVLVPLSQTLTAGNSSLILSIILFGLLFIGLVNFLGLSFANSTSIHFELAIRLIQDYFIAHDANTTKYLYFRANKVGIPGTGFRALITRGLLSGSPRTLLVWINSIIASIVLVKVGLEIGYWSSNFQSVLFGSFVFVISALIHVLIALIVHRTHGIKQK